MALKTRQPKEFTSLMIDTESRERLRKLAGSEPVASYIRSLTIDLLQDKPEKDPLIESMENEIRKLRDELRELWQMVVRLETRNLELSWLSHSWVTAYAEERKKHLSPDSPEYQECEDMIKNSESSWKNFRNVILKEYGEIEDSQGA
jgi:hypothetical protein